MDTSEIAAAAERMMARHAQLKQQRSGTQLLPSDEGRKLLEKNEHRTTASRKQPPKQKYRVITETVVIADKEYTHRVFIPLQSKRMTFMMKLNKKTVMPSTAIGK